MTRHPHTPVQGVEYLPGQLELRFADERPRRRRTRRERFAAEVERVKNDLAFDPSNRGVA